MYIYFVDISLIYGIVYVYIYLCVYVLYCTWYLCSNTMQCNCKIKSCNNNNLSIDTPPAFFSSYIHLLMNYPPRWWSLTELFFIISAKYNIYNTCIEYAGMNRYENIIKKKYNIIALHRGKSFGGLLPSLFRLETQTRSDVI